MAFCVPYSATAQPSTTHVAPMNMTLGIPILQVRIDGEGPFTFVLDTGTNCDAIISPRIVKRLGLSPIGRRSITDLGGHGTRQLDAVQLNTLSLAGNEFHAVRAVVADLPDGDSVLDGILGFRLFRDVLLTLDYPHSQLTFEEGELTTTSGEHVVPMRMPSGIPLVEIDIANTRMTAGIDSGGIGLSVPASMADKLSFNSGINTVAIGRTQVSSFVLRGAVLDGRVELAGFRFEQPWLELNPLFAIANIGSGALHDFIVTFDQRHGLVRFASDSRSHRLVRPKKSAGSFPLDELVGSVVLTKVY